jgi:Xaa-Pro aminopeptidase
MEQRGLAALVVLCGDPFSAPRHYLTSGVAITSGLVIKKRGDAPIIFANPMETEEAAKSGLRVLSTSDVGLPQMIKAAQGDRTKAELLLWAKCLEVAGVPEGRIGIYGVGDLNMVLELASLLQAAYPQYQFAGEMGMTLFDEAYLTKDSDEIARMQDVARKTNEAMQEALDAIRAAKVRDEALYKADGSPLTIGDVRRLVRRALLDRDLEDSHMIFAQGSDAGFPHSRGEDPQQLRLGRSIVFDLFPHEVGGGYFHDMTRTWCLGYAPPEVQTAYDEVMEAFDVAVEVFRVGMEGSKLQEAVEAYFESKGHDTPRSSPGSNEGYVHSLGHGLGLNIHERPRLGGLSKDVMTPGMVITIEPGLYYPDRGFGVRIEDTFYVDESGNLVSLTPFPKDLVIEMGNGTH